MLKLYLVVAINLFSILYGKSVSVLTMSKQSKQSLEVRTLHLRKDSEIKHSKKPKSESSEKGLLSGSNTIKLGETKDDDKIMDDKKLKATNNILTTITLNSLDITLSAEDIASSMPTGQQVALTNSEAGQTDNVQFQSIIAFSTQVESTQVISSPTPVLGNNNHDSSTSPKIPGEIESSTDAIRDITKTQISMDLNLEPDEDTPNHIPISEINYHNDRNFNSIAGDNPIVINENHEFSQQSTDQTMEGNQDEGNDSFKVENSSESDSKLGTLPIYVGSILGSLVFAVVIYFIYAKNKKRKNDDDEMLTKVEINPHAINVSFPQNAEAVNCVSYQSKLGRDSVLTISDEDFIQEADIRKLNFSLNL